MQQFNNLVFGSATGTFLPFQPIDTAAPSLLLGFTLPPARKVFPNTAISLFVRTADLEQVYAALSRVFTDVPAMNLEAIKYYYIPTGENGLAGIVAKPSAQMLKLQADIIVAMGPFMLSQGSIGAFTSPHADTAMDSQLIAYVSSFVQTSAGDHFNPHVTTGTAPKEYLDKMLAEPFESFTFSPAGAAVYQLGQFGTAAKKLKELDLK